MAGLIILVLSADKFVDGSVKVARYFKMPPLLIGMLIIGFGTSAPEMVVSVMSASQGNSGIALGNAFGSNITNIALILGLTSIFRPINVQSSVLKKELPILAGFTLLTVVLLNDLFLSRLDASIMLISFGIYLAWSILQAKKSKKDHLQVEVEKELASEFEEGEVNITRGLIETVVGLLILIASSRLFVWGAVEIAKSLGVSDIVIGLTVVAIGTSLPELASSIMAARKGESDMAIGNIIGSNLFNTMAVVGLAGVIHPLSFGSEVVSRDLVIMTLLTFALFILCFGHKQNGKISRVEGVILSACYVVYTWILL